LNHRQNEKDAIRNMGWFLAKTRVPTIAWNSKNMHQKSYQK